MNKLFDYGVEVMSKLTKNDFGKLVFTFLFCGISFGAYSDVLVLDAVGPPVEKPSANATFQSSPLSGPTEEERLRKGRDLLIKIISVASEIPLMDPVSVLKSFGFDEVRFSAPAKNPKYISAYPAGASDEKQLKLGFVAISVEPWTIYERGSKEYFAMLSAHLNTDDFCISNTDVDNYLGAPKSTGLILESHPLDLPRDNAYGFASYILKKTPIEGIGAVMVFSFKYQKCASRFSFSYKFKD